MKVIEFLDARKDVCPPDLGREDDERRVLLLEQLARYTRQAAFGYSRTSVRGRARPFRQENPDPGLRRGERACFPARLFISRFLFLPQKTKSPPPPPTLAASRERGRSPGEGPVAIARALLRGGGCCAGQGPGGGGGEGPERGGGEAGHGRHPHLLFLHGTSGALVSGGGLSIGRRVYINNVRTACALTALALFPPPLGAAPARAPGVSVRHPPPPRRAGRSGPRVRAHGVHPRAQLLRQHHRQAPERRLRGDHRAPQGA